jgi:UDP:flavonoid glycosyltransferase YjiC (YdhE family)
VSRVLIVAEAVTLAHVARPVALAAGLDARRFEIHLACSERFDALLGELPYVRHTLDSIAGAQFLGALDRGAPVYSAADLRRYVRADLDLLARVAPDVVVGDFRLSLSVSARLARIAYATITNVYWSPIADVRFPLPELPLTRALGVRPGTRRLFGVVQPRAFALHTRPLNRVRREHGLPSLGRDLRRTYTDADRVLYADAPELAPPHTLPSGHRFLGPVRWSPAVAAPAWWQRLGDDPVVYVSLGSSGRPGLLEAALDGLGELPVTVVAAAAGRSVAAAPNRFVTGYLPGDAACRRASVVVCNGGSPAVQQALVAGRPVVGIAANMDQHLSMGAVVAAGAGVLVRSEHATPATVARAVRRVLEDGSFALRAQAVGRQLAAYDAPATFARAVEEMISRA